jgi:hypothetical protein
MLAMGIFEMEQSRRLCCCCKSARLEMLAGGSAVMMGTLLLIFCALVFMLRDLMVGLLHGGAWT